MSEAGAESFDDVKMSREGMKLLLCNDWKAAEDLFDKYKHESILMSAGHSFVVFLQALLTFEEEQKHEAVRALRQTTELCKADYHKSRKSRRKHSTDPTKVEDRIQREVVLSDCLLYQATLIVLNQDMKSYVRGGWYIRQAWKRYRKLYHEVQQIYSARVTGISRDLSTVSAAANIGSADEGLMSPSPSIGPEVFSLDGEVPLEETEPDFSDMRRGLGEVSKDALSRLFGAVSFGYGVFRLLVSLIPPKILWWIQFLGFEGDQDEGLTCLEYCSQSADMKAPLATLTLVWYHTTVRPFFALDGTNFSAGVEEATRVLECAEREYPDSALFLYFKSRILRLQCDTEGSMAACRRALAMSENQRETQHICLYEIGRISMVQMNYQEAFDCFNKLRLESRWSKCFYAYLAGLSCGALGNLSDAMTLMNEVPKLMKMKNNQLEEFCTYRAEKAIAMQAVQEQMCLLVMEILYIWTIIPGCVEADLRRMLDASQSDTLASMNGLQCLIQGVLYNESKDSSAAEKCFMESISTVSQSASRSEEAHIAAFACFELGMLKAHSAQNTTDLQEAKRYFLQIKNQYKNYHFENRLSVKVSAALKRIAEAEKTADAGGKVCVVQ